MILFYDTETTGKYDFKRKPDHPSQPYLVQYAGLLMDPDTQRLIQALVAVVNPGVSIPKKATAIHGISTEMAQKFGTSQQVIVEWHTGAMNDASLAVAHNIDFDRHIMETAACRENVKVPESVKEFCTMKAGTNLCKLPGLYGYKWPKLEELHHHLFHESFQAHDALADVQACARCYFKMVGAKKQKPETEAKAEPESRIKIYSATCPLCGSPNTAAESVPGHVGAKYQCGCEVGHDLKVIIPCAAGVPKP